MIGVSYQSTVYEYSESVFVHDMHMFTNSYTATQSHQLIIIVAVDS